MTTACARFEPPIEAVLDRATALLADAEALLICAGAGMGVDSGLPDSPLPRR